MADEELERIYVIPLRVVKDSPRNHRADRAIRAVRTFLSRHMKADEVWIDQAVNQRLWSRGMYKIPSKIRVRARRFDDGVVEVSLPETEAKAGTSIRESIASAREKKLEEVHKGEAEAAERAEAAGAAPATGLTPATQPEAAPGEPRPEGAPSAPAEEPEKPGAGASAPEPAPKPPEEGAKPPKGEASKPAAKAERPAKKRTGSSKKD